MVLSDIPASKNGEYYLDQQKVDKYVNFDIKLLKQINDSLLDETSVLDKSIQASLSFRKLCIKLN